MVVDDEESIRELVRFNLQKAGYSVLTAGSGSECLSISERERPNLIILDVMLPDIDGFAVYRLLRRDSQVPVIFLTARDDELDRVMGLEMGADDYVTKPFSTRELVARVRAVLRRSAENHHATDDHHLTNRESIASCGNLVLDMLRHEVRLDGKPLPLTPKEFALLSFLMRHRGQVFSRDQLLDSVWDEGFFGDSRIVDVHIRHLREKIEDDPSRPRYIVTVRGVGYRFDG